MKNEAVLASQMTGRTKKNTFQTLKDLNVRTLVCGTVLGWPTSDGL